METRKALVIGTVSAISCWIVIFGFLYLIQ